MEIMNYLGYVILAWMVLGAIYYLFLMLYQERKKIIKELVSHPIIYIFMIIGALMMIAGVVIAFKLNYIIHIKIFEGIITDDFGFILNPQNGWHRWNKSYLIYKLAGSLLFFSGVAIIYYSANFKKS